MSSCWHPPSLCPTVSSALPHSVHVAVSVGPRIPHCFRRFLVVIELDLAFHTHALSLWEMLFDVTKAFDGSCVGNRFDFSHSAIVGVGRVSFRLPPRFFVPLACSACPPENEP